MHNIWKQMSHGIHFPFDCAAWKISNKWVVAGNYVFEDDDERQELYSAFNQMLERLAKEEKCKGQYLKFMFEMMYEIDMKPKPIGRPNTMKEPIPSKEDIPHWNDPYFLDTFHSIKP